MDATMRAIAEHGAVQNPSAVAAAQWRRMSASARKPWEVLRSLRESGVRVTGSHSPVTALAPLGPEVALPVMAAGKAAETITKVVTGDIIVIHSTIRRGTKKNPLPPLEVEYHVNLAAIGLGAAAVAIAALAGIIAWNGLSTVGGGFDGIKGSRGGRPSGSSGNALVDLFAGIGDAVLGPFRKITGGR